MTLFVGLVSAIFLGVVAAIIDTSRISAFVHWSAVVARTVFMALLAYALPGSVACKLTGCAAMFAVFGLVYRLGYHFFTWHHALACAPAVYDAAWRWLHELLPTWLRIVTMSPHRLAIAFEFTVFVVGGVAHLHYAC